jgi:hypothetical protein
LDHFVPEIEIGVHPCCPVASLNDHYCVGNERIAANVVEVKMRIDDDVDPRWVAVDRFEPRADFLARPEVEREEAGGPLPDAPGGVVLAVWMHPSVKEGRPLGMLDQISRDRQLDLALPTLHQIAEIPG